MEHNKTFQLNKATKVHLHLSRQLRFDKFQEMIKNELEYFANNLGDEIVESFMKSNENEIDMYDIIEKELKTMMKDVSKKALKDVMKTIKY